tara:strand:- start:561 stop:743 length:183 start_codon:yes stop_codon:yes gene_type:complete
MCDFFSDRLNATTSTAGDKVEHFSMPKDIVSIISSFSIFKAAPQQPATFDEQEERKQSTP